MTINESLLVQSLDMARKLEGPGPSWLEGWNQGHWRCGTGMCLAGWGVHLSGREWVDTETGPLKDYVYATEEELVTQKTYIDYRRGRPIILAGNVAESLFGLDPMSAGLLFSEANTLEDLEDYVEQIIEYGEVQYEIDHEDEYEDEDTEEPCECAVCLTNH